MNVDLAWIASVRFAQIQNSQVCNPLAREIKEANHDSKNVYVGNSSRNRRSNESKFEPMPEVESIRKMSFMSETNHQRLRASPTVREGSRGPIRRMIKRSHV